MAKIADALRDLRLVPPSIEAAMPDHVDTATARTAVRRFTARTNAIAELIAAYPWLADVQLTDRAGTIGSDLAGALEQLRQAVLALDLAIDARLLAQRKTSSARMSRLMRAKREAAEAEAEAR